MQSLCFLRNIIMRELAPQFQIPWSIPLEAEDIPIVPTTSGTMYVLYNQVIINCYTRVLFSSQI